MPWYRAEQRRLAQRRLASAALRPASADLHPAAGAKAAGTGARRSPALNIRGEQVLSEQVQQSSSRAD